MKKQFKITVFTILLGTLACCAAWSDGPRDVSIGDYLLLRVRCPAGGFTIDQRADAIQQRANDLLRAGKTSIALNITVSGNDTIIYTDGILFATVTPADAMANGTPNTQELAFTWANRLRTRFPKSTPWKPGVGRPDQRPGQNKKH